MPPIWTNSLYGHIMFIGNALYIDILPTWRYHYKVTLSICTYPLYGHTHYNDIPLFALTPYMDILTIMTYLYMHLLPIWTYSL